MATPSSIESENNLKSVRRNMAGFYSYNTLALGASPGFKGLPGFNISAMLPPPPNI